VIIFALTRPRDGWKLGTLLLLFGLLPGVEYFFDFPRPLNLSAATVAVFGGKKNLTFAILAEESLLFLDCLRHGHRNAREAKT